MKWRNLKLGKKMVIALLGCSLVPLGVVAFVSYSTAVEGMTDVSSFGEKALSQAATSEIEAMRRIKEKQVMRYFVDRKRDMESLVEDVTVLRQNAFQKFEMIRESKIARITEYMDSLKTQLHVFAKDAYTRQTLIDMSKAFEDSGKDTTSEAWMTAAAKYDARMKSIQKSNGWHDLFLIHADGAIVYTSARAADLGMTIPNSDLKDSPLGIAFARAEGIGADDFAFGDFAPYAPSQGKQSAFMMEKVVDGSGEVIGYVALGVPSKKINEIVQNRKGMGKTGESYLVGRLNGKTAYRSDRVVKSGKIGQPKSGSGIDHALDGESHVRVKTGSTGNMEIEAYGPVKLEGAEWCLISTQKLEEVVAPVIEGEKDDLFKKYIDTYGYYDLALFNPNGYCFYSVQRAADYRTNLVDGEFADSVLGRAVRECLETKEFVFGDFDPYAPHENLPSAFVVQPIMRGDDVELVVAFQLSGEAINDMMAVGSDKEQTLESFLVGSDGFLRSDSTVNSDYTVATTFGENKKVASEAIAKALAGQSGVMTVPDYMDATNPVMSAYAPLDVFGKRWALITGVDENIAMAPVRQMNETSEKAGTSLVTRIGSLGAVAAVVVTLISLVIARGIVGPLRKGVAFAETVAKGDLTQQVDIDREDEIGVLSKALNSMAGSLRETMRHVADNAQSLAGASTQLSTTATQLTNGAEGTTMQSSTVSAAAEEMSINMNNMASSTEQMSSNVKTVASAVEEMTASVSEIAKNAEQAASIAEQAASLSKTGNDSIGQLDEAADAIGKVIETIQDIAEQTNLLALNATIEAARAGDAGKGFAVVANEVKELAKQTAEATEDIRRRIEGIQNSTGSAVTSIGQIGEVIGKVNDVSRSIASAVEEQSITTKEIAQNIAQTASAAETVSAGVSESALAIQEINKNITEMDRTAHQTSEGAAQAKTAGSELSELGDQLQSLVGQFKV